MTRMRADTNINLRKSVKSASSVFPYCFRYSQAPDGYKKPDVAFYGAAERTRQTAPENYIAAPDGCTSSAKKIMNGTRISQMTRMRADTNINHNSRIIPSSSSLFPDTTQLKKLTTLSALSIITPSPDATICPVFFSS